MTRGGEVKIEEEVKVGGEGEESEEKSLKSLLGVLSGGRLAVCGGRSGSC